MLDWLKKLFTPTPAAPADPNAPAPVPAPQAGWSEGLKWVVRIATIIGVVGTFFLTWQQTGKMPPLPDVPPLPQQVVPQPDGPPTYTMGWQRDDDAVAEVVKTLEFKTFADTPAAKQADPLPKDVFLWLSERKVTGKNPLTRNQNPVGSCTGFGSVGAANRTLAVTVANGGSFEFKPFAEEVVYAGGRVEIAGGRIRGDGSTNAFCAKYASTVGLLPRGVYGKYDLTKYDPDRCRQWGYSGVPAEIRAEAAKYPVGDVTLVKSWPDAKKALANGHGIAVASDVGFNKPGTLFGYVEPAARDVNGCCKPNGEWNHSMTLDGYHTDDNGKEWGHIENSWGPNAHTGPVGWGDPNTAGFWTDSGTVDRMLKQGDSWAYSAVKGFPKQRVELDWFVNARPAKPRRLADPFAFALAP